MTNSDRIRAMTDEELAVFLCTLIHDCYSCPADEICSYRENGMLVWVQEEVDEHE